MALTPVIPVKVGNAPVALTTCSGLTLSPTTKVGIPTSAGDARTFPQGNVDIFVVHNTTGSSITLTAAVGKSPEQTAGDVSVDDKTYSIGANCICLIRTFPAVSKNGKVQLHASATGLQLYVFN